MAEAKIQLTAEDKTRAAFDSVRSSLSGLRTNATAVVGTLGALGVAGAAVTFAGMIKGAIDAGDEINKLSQRTGIAAEQLSQLQFAAKLSDVSTETLTRGIKSLNVSIAEGLAGDKEKIALFKSLGITTADLGKGTQAVMLKIADAYSTAKDGAGKVAVGNGLMGKSAEEMIPLLNGGSRAILDMMDRANKLGLTISTDFAQQAEEFNDNLALMKSSSTSLGIALASDLVGGLSKASKAMVEAYEAGGLLRGMIAGIQTLLTGDDQHKANKAIVDLTDQLMSSQDALDKARGRGDAATVARLNNRVTKLREEIALHQNYSKSLAEVAKVEEAAKPKKTNTITAPSRAGSTADSPELKEARRVAEARQQLRLAEEKAISDHFFGLREQEIKAHADSLQAEQKFNEEVMQMGRALTIAQGEEVMERNRQYQEGLVQAAKKAQDEIDKYNDQLSQSLTDALMRGGKNAADYLRDLFRTLVLRPLLQPVGNAMAGTIGQLPGAGGGSGLLGQVGQMAGMANFTGMSLANSAGSMFANITGGGLDALLATNGAFGTAGGAGIMGTLGSALPWVGGALALASLLESPRGGPKTIGGAADAATIQATVAATLATFGVSASGLRVGGFSAADPQGDSLTQLQTALFQGDTALYSRQARVGNYENVGRSSEELAAAWAEEQSRIMLAALQATLEPKYQQYMAGVSADAGALDEINAALARVTQARTLEERLLELSSSEAENLARARQRELDAMDASLRPLAEQIWALEDAAKAATTSLNDMRADIISYAAGLEDNAMAALERAIGAERATLAAARSAAQESVGTLRSVFDALATGARDLYGQVATTRTAAGIQGGAFIAQALATARASGYLPDGDQLNQAIGAARAGIDGQQYRTVKDREFAQLVLAGQLSQLKDISGDQLTEAERTLQTAEDQLRTLEKAYDTAKAQLDAIRGVDTSIMTLAQALAAFQGGIAGAANVRRAGGADVISGADIAAWVAPRLGVSEAANRALYDDALANRDRGVTLDKIDAAAGLAPGTSAAWAIANGLTPFEVGTNYVPMDMPAWLHEGEAVVPKRYNPAAGGAGAEAADLMNRLDKRFEQMDKRLAAIERSTLRTAEAANGRPEQPMPVEVIA